MAFVFAYGTLSFPPLMRAVCGQSYRHAPATLHGFARWKVRGQVYPGAIEREGAAIDGLVYAGVDDLGVRLLDAFEGELYRRCLLQVECEPQGVEAFVYTVDVENAGRLSEAPWDPEAFRSAHLARYVRACQAFHERQLRGGLPDVEPGS
ncbi:MAG: gamma-glutamylcyclotransferase [Gammaproteobacteria bacterium]|nr:gamma-glutamylcyclotransferase [Gammaproteobacteria bacterium]